MGRELRRSGNSKAGLPVMQEGGDTRRPSASTPRAGAVSSISAFGPKVLVDGDLFIRVAALAYASLVAVEPASRLGRPSPEAGEGMIQFAKMFRQRLFPRMIA
jgi:hypothetical protein